MKNSSNENDPTGGSFQDGASHAQSERKRKPVVNDALQQAIGSSLKAVYSEVLSQPVPDKFLDLLGQLEAKQDKKS
jgi:hypothetical protein